MNASVAIQVLPQQMEQKEMLQCVDAVIRYIERSGVAHTVTPFETVLEGDYDVLMDIVRACFRICVEAGAPGVIGFVKVNYCPDGVLTIHEKLAPYQA